MKPPFEPGRYEFDDEEVIQCGRLVLPDGRVFRVTAIVETWPPMIGGLEEIKVPQAFSGITAKQIATLMNGVLATENPEWKKQ